MSLLLLPVYTRVMAPEDFGVVAVATVVTSILSIVMGMGLRGAVVREYHEYRDDPRAVRAYLGTVTLFVLGVGAALALALLAFGAPLFGRFIDDVAFWPFIALAVAVSFLQAPAAILLSLWRAREQAQRYAVLQVARTLLVAASTVLFVVVLREGAAGWMKALFWSNLAVFAGVLALLARESSLEVSGARLRHALAFGLPLLPHLLASFLLVGLDRLVLQRLVSLHDLGLYSVAYSLAMVMGMVVTGINNAWTPIFYDTVRRDPSAPNTLARAGGVYVVGISLVAAVGMLFAREGVRLLVPPQYHEAFVVVPAVVLGGYFWGLYFMFVSPIFEKRKTRRLAPLTLAAALANLVLLYALVPRYGLVGAAMATAGGYALLAAVTWVSARRLYPIPYPWALLAVVTVILTGLAMLGTWAGGPWWASMAVRGPLAAALVVLGLATGRRLLRQAA